MTVAEIQNRLALDCVEKRHLVTVPNCLALGWEADLLSVTKSLFSHEFEIKLSRADYRAEFRVKLAKHRDLSEAFSPYRLPNHFWFVVPAGLVVPSEVPAYAGLIYVRPGRRFRTRLGISGLGLEVVRRAPRIHRAKVEPKVLEPMHTSLAYRFWNGRMKRTT